MTPDPAPAATPDQPSIPASPADEGNPDEGIPTSYYGRDSFADHELSALVPTADDLDAEWGWFLGFEFTDARLAGPLIEPELAERCGFDSSSTPSDVVFVQWVAAPAGPRNDFPPGDVPSISVELVRGTPDEQRAVFEDRTAPATCPGDGEPGEVVTIMDPPNAPGVIEAIRFVQTVPGDPGYRDAVVVLHEDLVYHLFVAADADAPAATALDIDALVTAGFERYEAGR